MVVRRSKRCAKCGLLLSVNMFYTQKGRRRSWCIVCILKHKRERLGTEKGRAVWKRYYRRWLLKKYYGMTLKQYDRLVHKQNGLCAICDNPETIIDKKTGEPRPLCVDHNHNTGQIRDLLCFDCNSRLLGVIEGKNAAKVLKNAMKYVRKWNIE